MRWGCMPDPKSRFLSPFCARDARLTQNPAFCTCSAPGKRAGPKIPLSEPVLRGGRVPDPTPPLPEPVLHWGHATDPKTCFLSPFCAGDACLTPTPPSLSPFSAGEAHRTPNPVCFLFLFFFSVKKPQTNQNHPPKKPPGEAPPPGCFFGAVSHVSSSLGGVSLSPFAGRFGGRRRRRPPASSGPKFPPILPKRGQGPKGRGFAPRGGGAGRGPRRAPLPPRREVFLFLRERRCLRFCFFSSAPKKAKKKQKALVGAPPGPTRGGVRPPAAPADGLPPCIAIGPFPPPIS